MQREDLLQRQSHFAFGENGLDYARKVDEAKISRAVADLRRLGGPQCFHGLSFLDLGCGSGLSALAAVRPGADHVTGVDIDPDFIRKRPGPLRGLRGSGRDEYAFHRVRHVA